MKHLQLTAFQIKRLEPDDAELLLQLLELFQPGLEPHPKRLQSLLERRDHVYLAASLGNRPVGWAVAYVLPRFSREECFLAEIDVKESQRRQGIATALINYLQDWCRQQNITQIFGLADTDKAPAIGLYAGSGGQPAEHHSQRFTWSLEA